MSSAIVAAFISLKHFFLQILEPLFSLLSYFVPPLMFLLPIFGGHSGQPELCNFHQFLRPDQLYNITNMGYPHKYASGSSCRWVLESDHPIRLTCERFNVPFTPGCEENKMILQDGDDRRKYYCGGDNSFSMATKSKRLTINLSSNAKSPGGAFYCYAVVEKNQILNSCECGKKNPAKIYGGEETGVNEFPMMAALVSKRDYIPLCGATIINKKQLLTAAHCVATISTSEVAILVGDHNIATVMAGKPDFHGIQGISMKEKVILGQSRDLLLHTGKDTTAARILEVDSFRYHKNYNALTSDYDIALVTIRGTFEFNEQISPICLPFQRTADTFAGYSIQVVGWGAMGSSLGPSNVLRKAILGVTTRQQCQPYFKHLSGRQLCTQEPGKDACGFDSGGPLVWHSYTTGRLIQIGIVSLGAPCGIGEPASNTRVGALLDWIEENTPPGVEYCKVE